jgi:hypothetical protein
MTLMKSRTIQLLTCRHPHLELQCRQQRATIHTQIAFLHPQDLHPTFHPGRIILENILHPPLLELFLHRCTDIRLHLVHLPAMNLTPHNHEELMRM